MVTKGEVQKLAALARVKIADSELETFIKEFDAIIAYVGQLESLNLPPTTYHRQPVLCNVMREDGEPHAAGAYTDKLVEQFASSAKATEGRSSGGTYLEVKQIISHD